LIIRTKIALLKRRSDTTFLRGHRFVANNSIINSFRFNIFLEEISLHFLCWRHVYQTETTSQSLLPVFIADAQNSE
jgi:hypothetical protein